MFSANASQVSNDVKYIEDFCSVYLRTGTGSSQTVTTGVKENTGALVISKSRSAATDWAWYDTFRGATKELASNTTAAEITQSQGLTSFNTDGHTWGTLAKVNTSGATYVDFVLKPTPKFFDVVTYTGNGANRTISHSLGSTPGCIIVKRTDTAGNWQVYHNGLTSAANSIQLNLTNAQASSTTVWNSTAPTSTVFSVGTSVDVNASGGTYVAYLFAHNAGGFGLTGTDNVISCGSFTTDGSGNATVDLGYEPQFVITKRSSSNGDWWLMDVMRGMPIGANNQYLNPNLADAEGSGGQPTKPSATGFTVTGTNASSTFIYIAIRRGPMKVPTTGTSVYTGTLATSSESAGTTKTTGFPIDLQIAALRDTAIGKFVVDRLRSVNSLPSSYPSSSAGALNTTSTAAEDGGTNRTLGFSNTGFNVPAAFELNNVVYWNFRRAPGFFDEVCYTGTGSPLTLNHNLGVAPELIIYKSRSNTYSWIVQSSAYPSVTGDYQILNSDGAKSNISGLWNTPTTTTFGIALNGNFSEANYSGRTYVAYLFASCPGVSKVGSYTGTGTTQQINCGFTGGARFVLIKRTDSTGDWYVWDSARGIVAGNDPYLLLNSTAAEVTSTDYVDTYSAGFEISSTAPAAINASGGTFIYLAIA